MNFYGESTTNDTKAGAKKSAKVEKAETPLEVAKVFYVEYPDVVYDEWYDLYDSSDLINSAFIIRAFL